MRHSAALPRPETGGFYGFRDLKAIFRRNMTFGVLFSALLCCALLVASVEVMVVLQKHSRASARWVSWVVPLPNLGVPQAAPPKAPPKTTAPPPSRPQVQPKVGTPVPVADTRPTTSELPSASETQTPPAAGSGAPAGEPAPSGTPRPGDYVYRDQEPELMSPVEPAYPEMARSAGVQGRVVLPVFVDSNGAVKDVILKQGIPLLNDAAIAAVKQYRFKPAMASGKPVGVWVLVPILFQLRS